MSAVLQLSPAGRTFLGFAAPLLQWCVADLWAYASLWRMSQTQANRSPIPKSLEIATPSRCVAGIPQGRLAGGMERPPTNQPAKHKPRQIPWRMVGWLLFATAIIKSLTGLTHQTTGLVKAGKELLRALGCL